MSAGDLSPDQAKFAQLVAAGTGLDPKVVTSWVGTESGWSVNKPNHNYLNIMGSGGQRLYGSTEEAANATVGLIKSSNNYAGIRASVVQAPTSQIEAIGASPWGTQKSTLSKVFESITGIRVTSSGTATPVDLTIPGWVPGVGGTTIPTTPGDVLGAVGDDLGKVASLAVSQVLSGTLSLVFTAGAIGLIGLGVYKVTQKPAAAAVKATGDAVGKVADVAGFIPAPQTKIAGTALKGAKAVSATKAASAAV